MSSTVFSVFRSMTLTSSPSLLSTYSRTFWADAADVAISKQKKRKRKAGQPVLCRMPHSKLTIHSSRKIPLIGDNVITQPPGFPDEPRRASIRIHYWGDRNPCLHRCLTHLRKTPGRGSDRAPVVCWS